MNDQRRKKYMKRIRKAYPPNSSSVRIGRGGEGRGGEGRGGEGYEIHEEN